MTVMIVDDEPLAIEYLRDMIDWQQNGYRIVAEASDTVSAVELFRRHHPDIVLSDIRIPGIDGLDFCREIMKTSPLVKIILVTAYSEFAYAKKAMGLGIDHYLLKHEITQARLLAELGAVRHEIHREVDEIRILARSVIVDRISGRENDGRIIGSRRKILEKLGATFVLILLREDRPYHPLVNTSSVPGESKRAELSLSPSAVPEGFRYIDCLTAEDEIQVHLVTHEDRLDDTAVKAQLEVPIRTHALEQNGRDCSAVILTESLGLEELTEHYRKAVRVFEGFALMGSRNLVFLCDVGEHPVTQEEIAARDADLIRVTESLDAFEFPEAISGIRSAFSRFNHPEKQPGALKETIRNLAAIIDSWALRNRLIPLDRDLSLECHSLEDLVGYFINAVEDLSLGLNTDEPVYSQKICKAILYLNKNYPRSFSVSDVAEDLGISESNLRKSFRQETGKSVLDFLTDIRIKVAKRLLVRTSLKIYQIAEMTGYSSSSYFGRVFVKETEMHPLEYRVNQELSEV